MNDPSLVIADNLKRVNDRIARAAQRASRALSEVTLVGVTKYVGIEQARSLIVAGCDQLGESRPQSLWEKAAALESDRVSWHLIGHLQRNKTQRTVAAIRSGSNPAGLIHSVDSLRLLKAINDAAQEHSADRDSSDSQIGVLLEVNISGDQEKHGWSSDDLQNEFGSLADSPNVKIRGLMTMASRDGGETVARENFAALRELRDRLQRDCPDTITLSELSMGMSRDLEAAIAEGATLIRVGSALFEGVERC